MKLLKAKEAFYHLSMTDIWTALELSGNTSAVIPSPELSEDFLQRALGDVRNVQGMNKMKL